MKSSTDGKRNQARRPTGHGPTLTGPAAAWKIRSRRRQAGVFAVMTVPLLFVLIGFCGLALEMGMVFNRVVDLHGMAKAVAIAAARQLNGTPAGILAAQAKAKETAESLKYSSFGSGVSFTWSDAALSFGAKPSRSGDWFDVSSAGGKAATLYYAKVDTSALDGAATTVDMMFMKILTSALDSVRLNESAVAGRTAINVTPIAVCAMGNKADVFSHPTGTGSTVDELVQYGYRRGVSYDLMQLNPNGTAPVRYSMNPVVAPDGTSTSFNSATLPYFVCKGNVWVPTVSGGAIRVTPLASNAPLAGLYTPLNSRFDQYTGGPCDPSSAPPDFNIKSYAYDTASSVRWMTPGVGSLAATSTTVRGKLETVADLPNPPGSPGAYGPLWAYAKAVKAPTPTDSPEPNNGYTPFTTADWPVVYKSGPTATNYPTSSSTPYQSTSSSSGNYVAPRAANIDISALRRRVLNIPLLSCTPAAPTGANAQATVLAVAKFFMTVPATQDKLIAEFAGLLPETSLESQVELFP